MTAIADHLDRIRSEALAAVPTVEQTPGLLHVWELVEGYHELYRGPGEWLLLEHAQRSGKTPAEGEAPTVYLRLEGPVETRIVKSIDPVSGVISETPLRIRTGPELAVSVDVLVRARPREVELRP